MKKILMISQTVFPPDIRLEKEIRSLVKADYNVTVICNQYERDKTPKFEYCDIIRIKALSNSFKLNKVINFPFFLNPRYLLTVLTTIFRFKPDYIHAHDLPMAPIAILFGKLFGLPIVFDMHENYPEALKVFEKKGLFNLIFKNYRLAQTLEKLCIKYSDRIIVVVEENRERLKSLGVNPDKIFIVSNTVDLATFTINTNCKINLSEAQKSKKIVLYTGTVSPDRGLLTPIIGMKNLKDNKLNLFLLIVGEGVQKTYLNELVKKENLSDRISFMDWPGHNYIPSLINQSSICMIPQPSNDFINTTIPHKLFEYMAMGKSVLTSDAIPFKRIIQESGAGLTFKSEDPEDFVQKLIKMIEFPEGWGKLGMKSVKEKYNWDRDAKVLINMYEGL